MEIFTKFIDILIFKRVTIICNDGFWDTIATYNVIQDEFGYLFSSNVGHRDGFNPVGKVFSRNKDKIMSICKSGMDLSYEVESPLREWPWQCKRLQFLSRCMYKISMNLTLVISLHNVISIMFHHRPIIYHPHDCFS